MHPRHQAIPNAPRSEVVGWLGDALKIKVHAPPVEGRANEALCAFLADTLGLPHRAVTVLRGNTSRLKTVRVDGLTLTDVHSRFPREPRPGALISVEDAKYPQCRRVFTLYLQGTAAYG